MSTPRNPVEDLFPEKEVSGPSAAAVVDQLNPLTFQTLAYDCEIGPNHGYVFRGELDFKVPLQSSLERYLIEQPLQNEKKLIEAFVEGEGDRVATFIGRLSPVRQSQPKDDFF